MSMKALAQTRNQVSLPTFSPVSVSTLGQDRFMATAHVQMPSQCAVQRVERRFVYAWKAWGHPLNSPPTVWLSEWIVGTCKKVDKWGPDFSTLVLSAPPNANSSSLLIVANATRNSSPWQPSPKSFPVLYAHSSLSTIIIDVPRMGPMSLSRSQQFHQTRIEPGRRMAGRWSRMAFVSLRRRCLVEFVLSLFSSVFWTPETFFLRATMLFISHQNLSM